MSNGDHSEPNLAVLVGDDEQLEGSGIDWRAMHVPVESVSELEAGRASRAVEDLGETIVIDGDDRVVSRALTAFRRRHTGRDRPVRFLPLRVGSFHRVADAVGGPRPSRRLGRQLAEDGVPEHWTTRRVSALRVTTSARRAPVWGFSVGTGMVYRLFETLLRSEGSGLSGLGSMASRLADRIGAEAGPPTEARGARVSVDYDPQNDELGYVVATALSATWLGLSGTAEEAPSWWGGTSGRQFLTSVAGSAALPSFLGGGGAVPFERMHIDGPGGFVVDGALFDPGEPHVLEVASGASATFVAP